MLYIIRYIIMLSLLLTGSKFPELKVDKMLKLKEKTEVQPKAMLTPRIELIDYPWAQTFNHNI